MSNKPEYLLTLGLPELFLNRYNLDLSDEIERNIQYVEKDFAEKLGNLLEKEFDYHILTSTEIEKRMKNLVAQSSGVPLINLDDVYFQNLECDRLSVTRLIENLVNFNEKFLGARKGEPPLESQIEKLSRKYSNKEVGLVDVGTFEGETLLDPKEGIIPNLIRYHIKPRKIFLSIVNKSALKKLNQNGIEVIVNENIHDFSGGDWLESRDLLGFDGRKINCEKVGLNGRYHAFVRYIENSKTLKEGASITQNVNEVLELCKNYNRKIMSLLQDNGIDVREGMLKGTSIYLIEFRDKKTN